jgi:uncharacterized membrane protein
MQARFLAIGAALGAMLAATAAGAASMDISKTIEARGSKPDWSLTVTKGTAFVLTRAGKSSVTATAPGAAISPTGASWTAKTADGQPMKVDLKSAACKIGGKPYPMTAQVVVAGETLSGCAN